MLSTALVVFCADGPAPAPVARSAACARSRSCRRFPRRRFKPRRGRRRRRPWPQVEARQVVQTPGNWWPNSQTAAQRLEWRRQRAGRSRRSARVEARVLPAGYATRADARRREMRVVAALSCWRRSRMRAQTPSLRQSTTPVAAAAYGAVRRSRRQTFNELEKRFDGKLGAASGRPTIRWTCWARTRGALSGRLSAWSSPPR